jgi:HEPN domain-containing protein
MQRRKTNEGNPADWFMLAADRLSSADVLWEHQGLTGTGIEALQEAVERYLKGYLIGKGWVLVKTHDLTRLIKEAAQYDHCFGQFKTLAEDLTEDFFAQHYPGSDLTKVGENYEELRRNTDCLVALIRLGMPQAFES